MNVDTLTRVSALGIATGVKMMTPAAIFSWEVVSGRKHVDTGTPLDLLRDRRVAILASVMAIGEVIADKSLPLPPRTSAGPLLPRMAMGATLGVLFSADTDVPAALGAGLGGIAAACGAFAATRARRALTEAGVADVTVAFLEDALAVGLAIAAMQQAGSTVA